MYLNISPFPPLDPALRLSFAICCHLVQHKTEGNTHLAAKRYTEAVAAYSAAIGINANNNIYFANRALARIELGDFAAALADCEASLAIDGAYSKAHYRAGLAQFGLKQYAAAVTALEAALRHNTGDDAHIRAKLAQAKQMQSGAGAAGAAANPFAALAGLGGLGGLGGGAGGMPDLGALMSNPAIAQMCVSFFFSFLEMGIRIASDGLNNRVHVYLRPSVRSLTFHPNNPCAFNRAQNLMSDPSAMSNMMNMMGPMMGGMGGGAPPAAPAADATMTNALDASAPASDAAAPSAGAAGGMPDFGAIMNNPAFAQMCVLFFGF